MKADTSTGKGKVDASQAEFARSRGWSPGADWGWRTPADLWVSPRGTVRIWPFTLFEKTTWIAATYYRAGDNVPHTHNEYPEFEAAIAAHSA